MGDQNSMSHEGSVTGLSDKTFISACFETSNDNSYLYAFRLDYSDGSVSFGPNAVTNACTSVDLPGKNIIGMRRGNNDAFIRLLYPCDPFVEETDGVTAYSSPIDLLSTGAYSFATLPLGTTDCYTVSFQLFRSLDN